MANKNIQNPATNRKRQQNLLQTEINDNKKSHSRTLQNEFNRLRSDLQFTISILFIIPLFFLIVMIIFQELMIPSNEKSLTRF